MIRLPKRNRMCKNLIRISIIKRDVLLAHKFLLFPHKKFEIFFITFGPLYEMIKISILPTRLQTKFLSSHTSASQSQSHSPTHLTLHLPHTTFIFLHLLLLGNSSTFISFIFSPSCTFSIFHSICKIWFSSAMEKENNNQMVPFD